MKRIWSIGKKSSTLDHLPVRVEDQRSRQGDVNTFCDKQSSTSEKALWEINKL